MVMKNRTEVDIKRKKHNQYKSKAPSPLKVKAFQIDLERSVKDT
jgi:hypothetical protein